MLEPGQPLPDARVWAEPREESRSLRELLAGTPALLCFYYHDWSPG